MEWNTGSRCAILRDLPYLVLILQCAFSLELRCPHPSHRKYRAISVCNGNNDNYYSCLFNKNSGFYVESCNQPPDFVIRGEEYVIVGLRTNRNCSPERYQPFKFWSNLQSKCYYKKSVCTDIGQTIYHTGNFTDDAGCACDFTQGYDYVEKPRNPCFCVSSEEDCSCYLKSCPVDTTLQSNYQCRQSPIKKSINVCLKTNERIKIVSRSENTTALKDLQAVDDVNANIIVLTAIVLLIATTLSLFVWHRITTYQSIKRKLDLEKQRYTWIQKMCANWSEIVKIENLNLPGSMIEENQLKHLSTREMNTIRLLKIMQQLQKMSRQQLTDTLNKLSSIRTFFIKNPVNVRWPKRDFAACIRNLDSATELLQEHAEVEDLADDFLQNFIFDVDDYMNIINTSTKKERMCLVINQIKEKLNEGSFECLLKSKTIKDIIRERIQNGLGTAFLLELTDLRIIETEEFASDVKSWKNRRIKFSIQLPKDLHEFANARIKQSTIWFIKIMAMYPDPKTVNGSSVVLKPLVDDIIGRLKYAINSKGLNHLIEMVCCEEHIIQNISKEKSNIHVSVQQEDCSCIAKRDSEPDNTEESATFNEYNILSTNAKFLRTELDVSAILESTLRKHAKKFDNFKSKIIEIIEREQQVQALIQYTEEKKLVSSFVKILEKENKFIANRLKSSMKAYATTSETLRNNIIENISEIIKAGIKLTDLKELMKQLSITLFDNVLNEQSDQENMLNVVHVVDIVNAGKNAMGALVLHLYVKENNFLADRLISTIAMPKLLKENKQGVYTILKENKNDLLLEAAIEVKFENKTLINK